MGINKLASDAFDAALTAFKATTPNRAQMRKFVAAIVTRGQEWLARFDAQDNDAPAAFAATKAAQFKTFTDSLPDPILPDVPAAE